MSSSSRSIAAARQKRAGEQAQPMNNSRPVTSISSQGAFAQQYQQQMMSQSIAVNSKNVRVAQNRSQIQGGRGSNQNIQQQQEQQDQSTKISVSNAIGLITLRLGKLEKMITEVSEEGGFGNNENNTHNASIPPNMKLVTDEVFENIVNRLNLLESKIINYQTEMSDVKDSLNNCNALLSSFINETNEKFMDYETALTEIENNFVAENNVNEDINDTQDVEIIEAEHENTLENNELISNENQ
jgi:hypothetical protein